MTERSSARNIPGHLRGGLLGLALGDALGAPHEFRYSTPLNQYTGSLQFPIKWKARYGPVEYSAIGEVTDDTTMTGALLQSIIRKGDWVRDDVIQSYLDWANSGIKFLGRNTRALFKGVKTIRGYTDRFNRMDLSTMESNGSLMRAYPFIVLLTRTNSPEAVYQKALEDTNLTNPNQVNRDATLIYLAALVYIHKGISVIEAVPNLLNFAQTLPIKEAINQAAAGQIRDVRIKGGWVPHQIYLLIQAWIKAEVSKDSFRDILNWVILQGGDTDTNGAIVGSLLGTYFGEAKMREDPITEQNLRILLNADYSQGAFPIDVKYHPATLLSLL